MKASPKASVRLPDLIANLQLDRYLVDDLVFKCNSQVITKGDERTSPNISIDFDAKENSKDKNLFLLEMVVDLNAGQDFQQFDTYQIHIHIRGWFRFTSILDRETKTRMLATNGSSMLYGVVRTIIANLTGSLGPQRYILPSLNLLAVIRAKVASGKMTTTTKAVTTN